MVSERVRTETDFRYDKKTQRKKLHRIAYKPFQTMPLLELPYIVNQQQIKSNALRFKRQGHLVLHIYFMYMYVFLLGASCARDISEKTLTSVNV